MNTQCETCGRQLPDDSFSAQCWRCSLGTTHPLAPFVWFALFVVALAIAWRWGMLAVLGLAGLATVGISIFTTRGAKRPVAYWSGLAAVAVVSLLLLGVAFVKS